MPATVHAIAAVGARRISFTLTAAGLAHRALTTTKAAGTRGTGQVQAWRAGLSHPELVAIAISRLSTRHTRNRGGAASRVRMLPRLRLERMAGPQSTRALGGGGDAPLSGHAHHLLLVADHRSAASTSPFHAHRNWQTQEEAHIGTWWRRCRTASHTRRGITKLYSTRRHRAACSPTSCSGAPCAMSIERPWSSMVQVRERITSCR